MTVYWKNQFSREQIFYGEEITIRPGTSTIERWYNACTNADCWFTNHYDPKANSASIKERTAQKES